MRVASGSASASPPASSTHPWKPTASKNSTEQRPASGKLVVKSAFGPAGMRGAPCPGAGAASERTSAVRKTRRDAAAAGEGGQSHLCVMRSGFEKARI